MRLEQSKDKENASRIEVTGLKNSEEFRGMVSQLNSELSGKLEIKLTDLVNRLLSEQEERARSMDDIKYQIDMKEKLN